MYKLVGLPTKDGPIISDKKEFIKSIKQGVYDYHSESSANNLQKKKIFFFLLLHKYRIV